ncbi:hypothetical protein QT13_02800 [Pectobacterium brasiliense]|uniref:DUF4194 domain-containing protein n=1 Tax=Pectobacterium TaxID=122277 RepID=UPI00057EB0F0|nr:MULTISPECIES: DUF4194 domain-containing protein [Pectobacterium]KHS74753.1 hypothetical protein QT13_02800 [Pectobacterium brasiliense]KHS85188.1 hypothetical protein RC83_16245 [Pectobacterium brasiliense]MBN3131591.1 DUF4194 domain-containing protein [Pectobacterium brasiliense]UDQ76480.1 DUF4194 domain-containing protein [Pectobacterium brasiliense]WJM79231.1 DUF4194 domain-containing protein [Pectobacterium brasiliense]
MASFFDKLINRSVTANAGGEPEPLDEEVADSSVEETATSSEMRTLKKIREATQELLKYGLLEEVSKPNLYRVLLTHPEEVTRILEPLDLDIGIDEIRGLLYVKVRLDETPEQDEWSHPLVRRQRLNLEQSLLVAILRQHFVAWEQESGTGAGQAQIAIDDLLPQLQIYLGDPGSESKERTRLLTLLDQLKGHGLVTSPDAHERIVIRPIIAHLADPINLQALLAWLREQIARQTSQDNASEKDSSEEDV